jgi:hypothetical protein
VRLADPDRARASALDIVKRREALSDNDLRSVLDALLDQWEQRDLPYEQLGLEPL